MDIQNTIDGLITLLESLELYIFPKDLSFFSFSFGRAIALGYFKLNYFTNAIKYLNRIINSCPQYDGNFVHGLTDALILLAESYSALSK